MVLLNTHLVSPNPQVGKNLPCIIPHMVEPVMTSDGTAMTVTIELDACYYPFAPEEDPENTVRRSINLLNI